jgi:hypothetical protein
MPVKVVRIIEQCLGADGAAASVAPGPALNVLLGAVCPGRQSPAMTNLLNVVEGGIIAWSACGSSASRGNHRGRVPALRRTLSQARQVELRAMTTAKNQ